MTPSETAKHYGFNSLVELATLTGESQQNLINWHKHKQLRFKIVCMGAMAFKNAIMPETKQED
jgi:hypothetical protein